MNFPTTASSTNHQLDQLPPLCDERSHVSTPSYNIDGATTSPNPRKPELNDLYRAMILRESTSSEDTDSIMSSSLGNTKAPAPPILPPPTVETASSKNSQQPPSSIYTSDPTKLTSFTVLASQPQPQVFSASCNGAVGGSIHQSHVQVPLRPSNPHPLKMPQWNHHIPGTVSGFPTYQQASLIQPVVSSESLQYHPNNPMNHHTWSTSQSSFAAPFFPVMGPSNQHNQHQYQPHPTHLTPFVVQTGFGPAVLLNQGPTQGLHPTTTATTSFQVANNQVHPAPSSWSTNILTTPCKTSDEPAKIPASLPSTSDIPITPSSNTRFQRWTEAEDAQLLLATSQEGGPPFNWSRISAKYFPNARSGQQCKARWKKALKPGLKRSAWEPQEDQIIMEMQRQGVKWSEIATVLPGRSADQIRQRFVNNLDPTKKKSPWTEEENCILIEAQKRLGNRWTSISELLPGRTENDIKNRWHNAKLAQKRKLRREAKEKSRLQQQSSIVKTVTDAFNQEVGPHNHVDLTGDSDLEAAPTKTDDSSTNDAMQL